MTLFLHDLYHGQAGIRNRWRANPMRFDDKAMLLNFWYYNCGHDWSQLNVTGTDMFAQTDCVFSGYDAEHDCPVYRYATEYFTRRYLVTDQDGRHVDPRIWGMPIEPIPWKYSGRWCWSPGSKTNRHRASGPAMWRGTARAADAANCSRNTDAAGDADWTETMPEPPVRSKALLSWYEQDAVYERRWYRRPSYTWKERGKIRSQHGRHDKAGKGRKDVPMRIENPDAIWDSLIADGFPVSPATADTAA